MSLISTYCRNRTKDQKGTGSDPFPVSDHMSTDSLRMSESMHNPDVSGLSIVPRIDYLSSPHSFQN